MPHRCCSSRSPPPAGITSASRAWTSPSRSALGYVLPMQPLAQVTGGFPGDNENACGASEGRAPLLAVFWGHPHIPGSPLSDSHPFLCEHCSCQYKGPVLRRRPDAHSLSGYVVAAAGSRATRTGHQRPKNPEGATATAALPFLQAGHRRVHGHCPNQPVSSLLSSLHPPCKPVHTCQQLSWLDCASETCQHHA